MHSPTRRREEGRSASRLEALTDSAFAFALTLLVIASGPPQSFDALAQALKTVPAFVASAALLLMFWHGHVEWSRRYGLDDTKAVVLTCIFTLTVMIYVYPLRLIAAGFFHWATRGYLNANMTAFQLSDVRMMFLVYGVGFVAMCGILVLLYRHAESRADHLGLDQLERFDARISARTYLILAASGVVSMAICLLPGYWSTMAGWAYALLGVVMPLWSRRCARERGRLEASLAAAKAAETAAAKTEAAG